MTDTNASISEYFCCSASKVNLCATWDDHRYRHRATACASRPLRGQQVDRASDLGLAWEEVEQAHLSRFLMRIASPSLRPLVRLDVPAGDLYGEHWSTTGQDVPDADSPDEAVFLPGRNVLLLSKAMVWCHLHGVPAVAMAQLGSNPFPDATPEFVADFQAVVNRGIGGAVRIVRPYARMDKAEVVRRGAGLPLEWTSSGSFPRDRRKSRWRW